VSFIGWAIGHGNRRVLTIFFHDLLLPRRNSWRCDKAFLAWFFMLPRLATEANANDSMVAAQGVLTRLPSETSERPKSGIARIIFCESEKLRESND
jgi:hypothetical protein